LFNATIEGEDRDQVGRQDLSFLRLDQ
jgi:hypothetical protein